MYRSKKNNNKDSSLSPQALLSPFVIGVSSDKTSGEERKDGKDSKAKGKNKRKRREKFARVKPVRKEMSIVTEYAATRRVNIILFSVISLIGVFIGIICAKELDAVKLETLRTSSDIYFSDITMSAMTVKILTSVLYSLIYVVVIFLGGFTIFAPIVSAAANLMKSALFGFMTAALIYTAGSKFDAGIAALYVLFGTAQTLILALASGEALGFSVFLLKNEESYKHSLSFPNVSLYSIRHFIFLALLASISVLETIIIPLMYDLMY